jgi:hypothetical protein
MISRPDTRKDETEDAKTRRVGLEPLNPEAELLVLCSRIAPNAEGIKALAQQKLDWTRLLKLATRHNLRPLLYWNLRSAAEAVPSDVLSALRTAFSEVAKHNLLLAGELIRITNGLKEAGVSSLSVKGPILAESLYGNLSLRASGDLDLLVPPGEATKAVAVLKGRGFVSCFGLETISEVELLKQQGEMPFIHHDSSIKVDLHTALIASYLASSAVMERLWERSREVPFKGEALRTLSAEDQLLYLCIHGTKHGWSQLKWIVDVSRHLSHFPEMDGELIFDEAARMDAIPMVHLGVHLAHQLYQTPLPTLFSDTIRKDASVPRLAAKVLANLFTETDAAPLTDAVPSWETLGARPSLKRRWRFLRFMLLPTALEWSEWRLPKSLYFLYPGLRLFRLSKKYSRRLIVFAGSRLRSSIRRLFRSTSPE